MMKFPIILQVGTPRCGVRRICEALCEGQETDTAARRPYLREPWTR